jgi:hypothetical protein
VKYPGYFFNLKQKVFPIDLIEQKEKNGFKVVFLVR